MKARFAVLTAGLIAGLFAAGCGNTSPTGGRTGATGAGAGSSANDKSATFTVKGPMLATTLTQGEKKNIALTLDRGTNFKDSVKLAADAPKGLKVDMPKNTVAAGDPADATLVVEAAADAPVGDHVIKVTATPGEGAATSLDVKVKVDAKK